ncbi:F-box domain-containing protein [Mycena venus]|uniref:F-box domain-containing protein n=1 Tax=Mycena venus TaxID=2733690 RepID=A0A8H7CY93_9AGAR|nr:F-box domain-containing protein [Mycena venus]
MSSAILRQRLVELDAEIVRQKLALAVLEQDRADTQRQLDVTSNFPILTLPVEIAAEIFTQCLPSIEELREDRRLLMSEQLNVQAPTVFLGVCRAWRDIALATPALWATLYLRIDIIDEDAAEEPGKVEAFIERWLERAAFRPLWLGFQAHCSEGEGYPDRPFTPSRLRDVIHRYAQRIEYLELDFSQHQMRQLGLDSVEFPLLRRATLGDWYGPEPDDSDPVEVFSNAPQLHDLRLIHEGIFSYYSPSSLQLTKFIGEIIDMQLFSLALNLTEASCSVEFLISTPTSPISHSCLQSLTLLISFGQRKPIDILRHLQLPALQSLHISEMEDTEYPSLARFLARSSPPLRTLSVCADDDEFEWAECFSYVAATLENLEVVHPLDRVQAAILNCHILSQPEIYPPFPRLQTLALKTTSGINYSSLIRFLDERTRRPEFAAFRSFRLVAPGGTFLDDVLAAWSAPTGSYRNDKVTGHLASLATNRGIDIDIGSLDPHEVVKRKNAR